MVRQLWYGCNQALTHLLYTSSSMTVLMGYSAAAACKYVSKVGKLSTCLPMPVLDLALVSSTFTCARQYQIHLLQHVCVWVPL